MPSCVNHRRAQNVGVKCNTAAIVTRITSFGFTPSWHPNFLSAHPKLLESFLSILYIPSKRGVAIHAAASVVPAACLLCFGLRSLCAIMSFLHARQAMRAIVYSMNSGS